MRATRQRWSNRPLREQIAVRELYYRSLILALSLAFYGAAQAAVTFEVLARTGDVVPGRIGEPTLTIADVIGVSSMGDGSVVIFAKVDVAGGGPQRAGIWRRLPTGQFVLIANDGGAALDLGPTASLDRIDDSNVSVSDIGQVAFASEIEGGTPTPFAIFLTTGGTAGGTFVAGQGLEAPGVGSGATFTSLESFKAMPGGGIAFSAAATQPVDDPSNIWVGGPGLGAQSPLFPPGTEVANDGIRWSSQVKVASVLSDGRVHVVGLGRRFPLGVPSNPPVTSIWTSKRVGTTAITEVVEGDPMPGLAGHVVTEISDVGVNDAGKAALAVRGESNGVALDALYIGQSGGNFLASAGSPVFRKNDTAPGTAGLPFSVFGSAAVANNGTIAFDGFVSDPTQLSLDPIGQRAGIWLERGDGEFELVVIFGVPLQIGTQLTNPTEPVDFNRGDLEPDGALVIPVEFSDGASMALRARAVVPEGPSVPETPPVPDAVSKPLVEVRGATRRSTKAQFFRIRGTASADVGLDRVEFSSRSQKKFRRATGVENWRLRTKLRIGRNLIRIRAIDVNGQVSSIQRIIVRRQKK